MEQIEKASPISESNIFHRCKKCKRLITTESNITNYQKLEGNSFKYLKLQKEDFIFFIKDVEGPENKISNKLEYTLSNIKNKILCKKCETVIGYFRIHIGKSKLVGILQPDYILSEPIEMKQLAPNSESEKPKLYFVNKIMIENKINIQKIKSTNEIISSFIKNFYRLEIYDGVERLSRTDKKIKNTYELFGLQLEDEDSLIQKEEKTD